MESAIRALVVPLSEQLTKQLMEFAKQRPGQRHDPFTPELLLVKLLAQMGVALIAGLITL